MKEPLTNAFDKLKFVEIVISGIGAPFVDLPLTC
jgi:hypothetical protein